MNQLQARFPKQQIGIVDDNPTNLRFLEQVLLRAGYEVVVKFSHPMDVIEYLRYKPLSILLCDHHMPYVNGIELFQRIKSEVKSPPITFLVTAVESNSLELASRIQGMAGFIGKPFDIHTMVALLDQAIESAER